MISFNTEIGPKNPGSPVEQPQDPCARLPQEMTINIFKHLGAYDLGRAELVNHTWNMLANDNQLWRKLGRAIGIPKINLKENPEKTVIQEIKKIKGQAIVAGIKEFSLNTPVEINHVKIQIVYKALQTIIRRPQKTLPESIQNLLNGPATPENLAKLERWLMARSTVIVYEGLKLENNNLTDLDAGLLDGDQWEKIFNLYAEWSEENQNELQNITELNLTGMIILKLPEGAFDHLENLEGLELAFNQLQKLPNLDKLKNLKGFGLTDNQLSELPNLDKLESLEILDLSKNQLSELPKGIFDKLKKLKSLNLSKNQLSELPNLDQLETLEKLWLIENKIDIDSPALKELQERLRYIRLSI